MHIFTKIYFNHEANGKIKSAPESFPMNGHVNMILTILSVISVFFPFVTEIATSS
jgi:hypothetical protein